MNTENRYKVKTNRLLFSLGCMTFGFLTQSLNAIAQPSNLQRISQPTSLNAAEVDPEALDYVLACNEKFKSYIGDYSRPIQNVILADFSQPMEEPRLYVIQLDKNNPRRNSKVALRTWVSHGSGSGRVSYSEKNSSQRKTFAKNLSDLKATQTTPPGCFRIFGKGEPGVLTKYPHLRGFYISGLEKVNECSHTKGIRMHEHPEFINPLQKNNGDWLFNTITNSSGCLRVDGREIEPLKYFVYPSVGNLLVIYPGTPRANTDMIQERVGLANYYRRTPMEYENEILAYKGNHPKRTLINPNMLTKSPKRNCEAESKMNNLKGHELEQVIKVIPKKM